MAQVTLMRAAWPGALALVLAVVARADTPPTAEVSSGTQATTVHIPVSEPLPQHVLRAGHTADLVLEGVGVAVGVGFALSPAAETYRITKATFDIGVDTALSAVSMRNDLAEMNLLVIDRDIGRLQELRRNGAGQSDEARRIAGELAARARQSDGAWSFLGKALASPEGLYSFDVALSTHFLESILGEKITDWLGVGEHVDEAWRDTRRTFRSQLTRTAWRKLRDRARTIAKQLSHSAVEGFLRAAVMARFDEEVKRSFQEAYGDILSRNPSQLSGGGAPPAELMPYLLTDYRRELTIVASPAQLAAPAAMAQAPRARMLAMPAAVVLPADPVMRAVVVEDQVAHYAVSQGAQASTYSSSPSSGSLPGHRIDFTPTIGGSWDGNGISLWH